MTILFLFDSMDMRGLGVLDDYGDLEGSDI